MTCAGTGIGCTGEIQEIGAFQTPAGPAPITPGVVGYPRGTQPVLRCDGHCTGRPTTGTFNAVARSPRALEPAATRGTTITILLRMRCRNAPFWQIFRYDLAFDNRGRFNQRASNLAGRFVAPMPG